MVWNGITMLVYLPQQACDEMKSGLIGRLFVVAEDEQHGNTVRREDRPEVMYDNRPDVLTISSLTSRGILSSYARIVFPAPAIPH
jgi:hypothetical protein